MLFKFKWKMILIYIKILKILKILLKILSKFNILDITANYKREKHLPKRIRHFTIIKPLKKINGNN